MDNTRAKLDFLVLKTGLTEAEIIAQAVDIGLSQLYLEQISDDYLAGIINREMAIHELGKDVVDDLDTARKAIDDDIAWGLRGASEG